MKTKILIYTILLSILVVGTCTASRINADYYITNDEDNKTQFLNALSAAVSGDIIYLDGNIEMNLTDNYNILVREGITIKSNRGVHHSKGALLYSYDRSKTTYGLFKVIGNNTRFSGIRLNGTDYNTETSAYVTPPTRAIYSEFNIEIDNSELSGWSHAAICIYKNGYGYIHDNFIHHNRRAGLGYGVVIAYGANALIERNTFDWNRHSIAGDGKINTSYTARYNLVLGNGNGHAFDMHSFHIGNYTYISGKTIEIYGNTFYKIYHGISEQYSIVIRGVPVDGAYIHNNIFETSEQKSFLQVTSFGNVSIYDNKYNVSLRRTGTIHGTVRSRNK